MKPIVIEWLQRNWPIWLAFILAFIPPLIAELKGRPKTRWYLYGLACALVAWPLVTVPTTHALLLRRRNGLSEQISRQRRRRADALALLAEDSVRSYPSWIAELNHKSPAGIDRRRYAYEHLAAGEALELVRESTSPTSEHAVSCVMIESIMCFGIGFLAAALLGLLFLPAVHNRALKAQTTSPLAELGKKTEAINQLEKDLAEKNVMNIALETRNKTLRDQLRAAEEELQIKSNALVEADRQLAYNQAELAKVLGELGERALVAH
jgi:hypothetical protein